MRPYLDLLEQVLTFGEHRSDRTGVGTISLFGTQTRYDLRDGFPLCTTKKINFDNVVRELLWFLSGSTNVQDLHPCKIWDPWQDEDGELGPIYGYQWRHWGAQYDEDGGIDQIKNALSLLKTDPFSRRNIVSAWNVADLPLMRLPPCHVLYQFYVAAAADGGTNWLDCQLYQRSADLAIGVPYNVASYALLMSMLARECNLRPRFFIHTIGDAHIYNTHITGVKEQLKRRPKTPPRLVLTGRLLTEYTVHDIRLEGYDPHPFVNFEVVV
jgi:thymidylate synthase